MLARRYTTVFTGINDQYFTQVSVAKIWASVADEIYAKTGVYITGIVSMSYFVCGNVRDCEVGGPSTSIISIWNPMEVMHESIFYDSYSMVVKKVRKLLENPYMGISIEEIEFHYFLRPRE